MAKVAKVTTTGKTAASGAADASVSDAVFESLLRDIVSGVYLRGARLPGERDLAEQLGASRASVRDALRRLSDWNLIVVRHGSGAAVCDRRDWSFEALPACLRYGDTLGDSGGKIGALTDALALRRGIVVAIVRMAAGRIGRDGLTQARATVQRAWRARKDPAAFAEADFEIMRQVVETADMLPAVWLLNRLSSVYREAMATIGDRSPVTSDYVDAHMRVFDSLERGYGERAARLIDRYMEEADRQRLAARKSSASKRDKR